MSLKLYHIASFYRGVAYFSAVNSIVYLYQILWQTYRSSRRKMHDKPSKMYDDSVSFGCGYRRRPLPTHAVVCSFMCSKECGLATLDTCI